MSKGQSASAGSINREIVVGKASQQRAEFKCRAKAGFSL